MSVSNTFTAKTNGVRIRFTLTDGGAINNFAADVVVHYPDISTDNYYDYSPILNALAAAMPGTLGSSTLTVDSVTPVNASVATEGSNNSLMPAVIGVPGVA